MNTRDKKIDGNSTVVRHTMTIGMAPAINLTNAVIEYRRLKRSFKLLGASIYTRLLTATVGIDLRLAAATDRIIPAILAIDAVPEKFKLITSTVVYSIAGVIKTKAPATAIVFSAAHVITANKAGSILVQVDAAGTVTTKVSAATQAYPTVAAAIAALPLADASKLALGHIDILNNAVDWTANTDDMTNGSDVATAAFTNLGVRKPLTGAMVPVAGDEVDGVLSATETDIDADQDEYLVVIATTDGTGALTNAHLHLDYRARAYRGDSE